MPRAAPPRTPGLRATASSRTPRGHWVLVSLVMVVFAVGLLVEGYTHGVLGETIQASQPGRRDRSPGPASLLNDTGRSSARADAAVRSYSMPPARWRSPSTTAPIRPGRRRSSPSCAVTGCPRPSSSWARTWPATRAWSARNCSAGDEVGSHTYTHLNLAAAAGVRASSSRSPRTRWPVRPGSGRTCSGCPIARTGRAHRRGLACLPAAAGTAT